MQRTCRYSGLITDEHAAKRRDPSKQVNQSLKFPWVRAGIQAQAAQQGALDYGLRFRCSVALGTLAITRISDAPNRPSRVVRHQQRPVSRNRQCGRPPPHLCPTLARGPEPSGEVLVIAFGSSVLEWDVDDFVAGRNRSIP